MVEFLLQRHARHHHEHKARSGDLFDTQRFSKERHALEALGDVDSCGDFPASLVTRQRIDQLRKHLLKITLALLLKITLALIVLLLW